MDDDKKMVPASYFGIAAAMALCSTLAATILGFTASSYMKSEEQRREDEDEYYTVCFVDDMGFIIKSKELEGSAQTKNRQVLLADEQWYKYVYDVDDLLIIGEYPDRESAIEVLEVINRYTVTTEVPTLEEPSGEIKK